MEKMKAIVITVSSALISWLGILAVPVFLLVGCNLIDYVTGLAAAKYRTEAISSYKGIRGIVKKVCMWLLIVVGVMVDALIQYGAQYIGLGITVPFIVATVVAVWLIVNEIISILENMVDIGVEMPPFLMPLVKRIKNQVEEKAGAAVEEGGVEMKEEAVPRSGRAAGELEAMEGPERPEAAMEAVEGSERPEAAMEAMEGPERPEVAMEAMEGSERPETAMEAVEGSERPEVAMEAVEGSGRPEAAGNVTRF